VVVCSLVAFLEPVAYVIWTVLSVAALVWAWHVAAPFQGLAKLSLLLLAFALWPVMQALCPQATGRGHDSGRAGGGRPPRTSLPHSSLDSARCS
jgi:hypothetical protein